MTYRGTVKGGVVVLEPEGVLRDGTVVQVEPIEQPAVDADPLARMGDLAVETGVNDLASNIDHYLYGHPKRDHGR